MEKPTSLDSEKVTAFIHACTHPKQNLLQPLREIILGANKKITEHIKWNGPSFCINGDDRITFNLSKKDGILIVFHRGAKSKDSLSKPLLADSTGTLTWITTDRATAKFNSLQDVSKHKLILKQIAAEWVKMAP